MSYELPPILRGFVLGDRVAMGCIDVEWHSEKWIKVPLVNTFNVKLNLGALGSGTRDGMDSASGLLALQDDGTYEGTVEAHAKATQMISNRGGDPVSGHLALEFRAETEPHEIIADRCQNLIHRDPEPIPFIPLNDARWTIPEGSYAIAYPESGKLSYTDEVVMGPLVLTRFPGTPRPGDPTVDVGKSYFTVTVERSTAGP